MSDIIDSISNFKGGDHQVFANNSDSFIKLKDDVQQAFAFCNKIKALLFFYISTTSNEAAIAEVERLKKNADEYITYTGFYNCVKSIVGESFTDEEALSRVDHLESFHRENLAFRANVLATLGNPDNAITEIERLQSSQNYIYSFKQKELINLNHVVSDLRIAKKVIARLVGE